MEGWQGDESEWIGQSSMIRERSQRYIWQTNSNSSDLFDRYWFE